MEPESPAISTTPPATAGAGDRSSLEQLEADLAAVESAMESLERIAGSDTPGAARAAEIAAVVSPQRFPLARDPGAGPAGSELVGDRLFDE